MSRNPSPPENLEPEAKQYWRKVNKNWRLDGEDLEILKVACFALSRMYQAQKLVDRHGLIFKLGENIRQNPAIRIEKEARAQFLAAIKQLDLTDPEEKRPPGRPPERW